MRAPGPEPRPSGIGELIPPCRFDVRLHKRIPVESGLGGGSADAAAVLRLLAGWRQESKEERLFAIAEALGSDVPFSLLGSAAVAEGRGERLTPVHCPRPFWVVLVLPPVRVSTAWCYTRWDELGLQSAERAQESPSQRVDALTAALGRGDLEGVAKNLFNDLERPVLYEHPSLKEISAALVRSGCVNAQMSGSGSCFFGLAPTLSAARDAARGMRRAGMGHTWVTRTLVDGET